MKKILFIVISLVTFASLQAQDIRTTKLTWTVTALTDQSTNKNSAYSCVFETNGQQAIVWKQKNGTYIETLGVTQLVGTWASVQANGQVVYNISLDSETGTLTFARNATGAYITIDLSQPGGSRLKHKYSVGQVVGN
jgi:hypothetical protein